MCIIQSESCKKTALYKFHISLLHIAISFQQKTLYTHKHTHSYIFIYTCICLHVHIYLSTVVDTPHHPVVHTGRRSTWRATSPAKISQQSIHCPIQLANKTTELTFENLK